MHIPWNVQNETKNTTIEAVFGPALLRANPQVTPNDTRINKQTQICKRKHTATQHPELPITYLPACNSPFHASESRNGATSARGPCAYSVSHGARSLSPGELQAVCKRPAKCQ